MPKSFYLIDGHAQMYRAYYAPFQALSSPTGEPTRAVHVFVQMLLNLIRDRKPDYLAMVMDVSDGTVFRVGLDATYKSNRQPPPEDLEPQIDRIVSILDAMKIPILRKGGFEADDLIATLTHRHAGDELDIFIVSRDKDLDQLLGDHVRMFDPGKDRVIDVAAMIAEKGYGPDQAIEAQMLIGDSVDCIKGVDGVGPKKAADLLKKYGTVDAILSAAAEMSPKLKENLLAFRSRKDLVRQLVTLRKDVEFDFDLAQAEVGRFQPEGAAAILNELGMHRMLDRIKAGIVATTADSPKQEAPETKAAEPEIPSLFQSFEQSRVKYDLIDTEPALVELVQRMQAAGSFAFDTETTGLVPAACDLVGVSISWEIGSGCYIPVRGVGRTIPLDIAVRHLKPVLENPAIRKCGQNLKYDLVVLKTVGIEVQGVDFDSMIASFVLDSSRRSHGLDALSMELLNYRPIATHELIGKGKDQTTFDNLPTDRVCEYAAEDADVAWQLRGVLDKQMTDPELKKLFAELEMPLVGVLAEMEYHGVKLDTDLLARISNEMAQRLMELREQIHGIAGRPFNIDSTRQLAEVLFDERKLPVVKKTRTGRSTDAEVLEVLRDQTADPIPKLVLEYRELAKLKGTYVDALPEMISRRTGRVHPSFHQTGAVTGRLSCSDPNLQNIPIRTPVGAQIRAAFVPGSPADVLLTADYSQIELRVLAHFCGDEALADAFRTDLDIHAFVAAQLEGIPIDQVTSEQRGRAKTVNFGIVYGQSAFGLARQTGMSVGQAKVFIDRYFERYPKIRGFLDECIAHARRHGYVKTILGRRRAIADINSRNQGIRNQAERLAVNTVVQGSAADLIKRAMLNIHRRIHSEKRPVRMLIQVHDELVFEVPRGEVEKHAAMISDEMAKAIPLQVPVKVDIAWGANWLEGKE